LQAPFGHQIQSIAHGDVAMHGAGRRKGKTITQNVPYMPLNLLAMVPIPGTLALGQKGS
jgi:hypothetical protein